MILGTEGGRLIQVGLQGAAFGGFEDLLPERKDRGSVESLAISPDGLKVAAGVILRRIADPRELPDSRSEVVVIRLDTRLPDRPSMPSESKVYACAFSADGSRLAFADGAKVVVQDLAAGGSARTLRGRGAAIPALGFLRDGLTVGFARSRPDPGSVPSYRGFDLLQRRAVPVRGEALQGAVTTDRGLTIRPATQYSLNVLDEANRGWTLNLDSNMDGRWRSFSFLPGRPRPMVAVGCRVGTVLFRLDADGRAVRTHIFAGHSGDVLALAPSPDGKWLATGSEDQTIRLWSLEGCDRPAELGATFLASPNGQTVVGDVRPMSFAETVGMKPGDVIETFQLNDPRPGSPTLLPSREEFLKKIAEGIEPNTKVSFHARRKGFAPNDPAGVAKYGTSLRDGPTLTLFPTEDREWVLWTPQGYYDSSVEGDFSFLGWQKNRGSLDGWKPSLFFRISEFERELRRPEVLDRLIRTGRIRPALASSAKPTLRAATPLPPPPPRTLAQGLPKAPRGPLVRPSPPPAVATIPRPPADARLVLATPPSIRFLGPSHREGAAVVSLIQTVEVRVQVEPQDGRPVVGLEATVEASAVPGYPRQIAPRAQAFEDTFRASLQPGLNRVVVRARNDRDKAGEASLEIYFADPKPRPPRVLLVAIAAGAFPQAPEHDIRFAEKDAPAALNALKGLADRSKLDVEMIGPLTGQAATSAQIDGVLDGLDQAIERRTVHPGDTVVMFLESHFLRFGAASAEGFAGADLTSPPSPKATIPAAKLAHVLGRLRTEARCQVVLMIDAIHDGASPQLQTRPFDDWVRELTFRKGVITVIASKDLPSLRGNDLGLFAWGLTQIDQPRNRQRFLGIRRPEVPLTLDELGRALSGVVGEESNSEQAVGYYIPASLSHRTPFLAPPTDGGRVVRAK